MAIKNNSFIIDTKICDSCWKKLQRCLMLQIGVHLPKRICNWGISDHVHNYGGLKTMILTSEKYAVLESFNNS